MLRTSKLLGLTAALAALGTGCHAFATGRFGMRSHSQGIRELRGGGVHGLRASFLDGMTAKNIDGKEIDLGATYGKFGAQEPGTDAQIKTFATSNYGVKPPFYLMSKIDVNGDGAHPLYKKLKAGSKQTFLSTIGGKEIKWNFTKFLISNGNDVARYEPVTAPKSIDGDIAKAIEASKAEAK